MEKDTWMVDGFVFPNEKEMQIAIREQKNIEVIRQRVPFEDAEAVYEIYTKLIDKKMFKTVLGYSFLYELRCRLVFNFGYEEADLPVVELPDVTEDGRVERINLGVLESKLERATLVQKRMTITIVILLIMIASMFVIAAVNPDVHYVNTENKILNKYAAWQEELEQREQAVKEKEAQLNLNNEK